MEETEVSQATATEMGDKVVTIRRFGAVKKLLLMVVLMGLGIIGVLSGVMVGLATVAMIPAFLYGMIAHPIFSVGLFAYYLVTTVAFLSAGGIALGLAYKVLRKREMDRHWKTVFVVSLVLAIVSIVVIGQVEALMNTVFN